MAAVKSFVMVFPGELLIASGILQQLIVLFLNTLNLSSIPGICSVQRTMAICV